MKLFGYEKTETSPIYHKGNKNILISKYRSKKQLVTLSLIYIESNKSVVHIQIDYQDETIESHIYPSNDLDMEIKSANLSHINNLEDLILDILVDWKYAKVPNIIRLRKKYS